MTSTERPDNSNDHNEESWATPMPGESNDWFQRFSQFVAMGPGRSMLAVYAAEKARKSAKERDKPKTVPEPWRKAAQRFEWIKRAEAFDAHLRKTVFSTGNALDSERVKKLDTLIDSLHTRAIKALDNNEPVDLIKLLDMLIKAIELMAKHTGGFAPPSTPPVHRLEHTGKNGGKIEVEQEQTMRVVFYVPEVEEIEDMTKVIEVSPEPAEKEQRAIDEPQCE